MKAQKKNNILDLIFTNNDDLIINCRQIINSKLSDHNTILAKLSYGLEELRKKEKVNFSASNIPEYNLNEAYNEDWLRMIMILQKVNWQDKLKDKSVTEMVNTLNKDLEDVTEKVMTKIDGNPEKICLGDGSSNKIPKQVGNLFRQKKKASDALKTVTSVKKCLAMRAKVEKAEEELKNLYKERKV